MAKNRYVDTRFWHDTFIRERLNPLDRYLFLYFLTNDKTSISGIYECPMSMIASETGIEIEMLNKMLKRFVGKIYYIDGWVFIKNFQRYQNTNSPKIKIGIDIEMSKIPSIIRAKIDKILKSQIGYGYGMHTQSHSNTNINTNSNLKASQEQGTTSNEVGELKKEINKVASSFKVLPNKWK